MSLGFRPSVGLAYTGEYCATQAQRVGIAGLMRNLLPGNVGAMVRAINGTTAILCDEMDDITEDDVAPLPFEGGQCPGVQYRVTAIFEDTNCGTGAKSQTGRTTLIQGPGPLSRTSQVISSTVTRYVLRNGNGVAGSFWDTRSPCGDGQAGSSREAISLITERLDGLPDDCGNPPRVFPDPLEPLPLPPIDFTWENNQGVTVNATANITLSPAISLNGNVSFPTNIQIGELSFVGNFNLDGGFTFAPSVNIGPPGASPTLGPENPGADPAPDEKTGSVLEGVVVKVTSLGPAVTVINSITAPNLIIPRAATVNFLVEVEGDPYWTSDLDAKNGDCFVPSPPGVICIDAAVTPYPGVVLDWAKVFREERVPIEPE